MYKIILPFRYFVKRRISYIAVTAVALCVFIVVVVITVMNGLVNNFRNKNHDFVGECIVGTDSLVGFAYYEDFLGELREQEFVSEASAVIKGFGLMTQPGADWNIGVKILGIEPVSYCGVTAFARTLHYHKGGVENIFVPLNDLNAKGCIVGIDFPGLWDRDRQGQYSHSKVFPQHEFMLSTVPLTARGGLAQLGVNPVNTKKFYYSDDSHSKLVRTDERSVYIPFETAAKLCGMDGATGRASAIHVKFVDGVSLKTGCEKVRKMWNRFVQSRTDSKYANLLENVNVESWIENRRQIIAPMEKEQTMLILLFMMLGVITVFVILVVFYMIISHKSKDIGILKSVGVSNFNIIRVFLRFAMIIGIIGAAIGSAAGCGFLVKINDLEAWLFEHYNWQLWDRSVYAIEDIPNDIEWEVLMIIIFSALAASLVGSFLPSYQAARRQPAEILQVNQL